MTTDPRLVSAARPVIAITYEEAAELGIMTSLTDILFLAFVELILLCTAYFGAEVLHPISMQPAIRTSTPVRVKNSYNPKAPGTTITYTRDKQNSLVII
jgi:aspartate kinase